MKTLTNMRNAFCFSMIWMLLLNVNVANAGFLNDLYNDASSNMNISAGGSYDTQNAHVFTGGGLTYKVPNKTITPFTFTPPSLKAGCGGIQAFLGSWGIMSSDELVEALRAIGQNLPGLLFQVALDAMSPELSGNIKSFFKDIKAFTDKLSNSCEAARLVADKTGLTGIAQEMGTAARNWGVAAGIFDDHGAAKKDTDKDGGKTKDVINATAPTDSTGAKVEEAEMNLTWKAMKSGTWNGLTDHDKEMLQTIVGTVVITWPGVGADKKPVPDWKHGMGMKTVKRWVGGLGDADDVVIDTYVCTDNYTDCLAPELKTDFDDGAIKEKTLSLRVKEALNEFRSSILERREVNDVNGVNPIALISSTNVPIVAMLNVATSQRFGYLSSELINYYSQRIAYEIAFSLVEEQIKEVTKMLESYQPKTQLTAPFVREFRDKNWKLYDEIQEASRAIRVKDMAISAYIDQISQIEKTLYSTMSISVAKSLKFGSK
jgi:conjugative transfer pilus assembly protein TraH